MDRLLRNACSRDAHQTNTQHRKIELFIKYKNASLKSLLHIFIHDDAHLERCSETNRIWIRTKCRRCAMVLFISKPNKASFDIYVSVAFSTLMSSCRILQSSWEMFFMSDLWHRIKRARTHGNKRTVTSSCLHLSILTAGRFTTLVPLFSPVVGDHVSVRFLLDWHDSKRTARLVQRMLTNEVPARAVAKPRRDVEQEKLIHDTQTYVMKLLC